MAKQPRQLNPWDRVVDTEVEIEAGEIDDTPTESSVAVVEKKPVITPSIPEEEPVWRPKPNVEGAACLFNDPDEWEPNLSIQQKVFLSFYSELGNVKAAADATNMLPREHYVWLRTSETYEAEFQRARNYSVELIEYVAWTQARQGNQQMLKFLLKGLMPAKYGDMVRLSRKLEKLTDDDLKAIIKSGRTDGSPDTPGGGDPGPETDRS